MKKTIRSLITDNIKKTQSFIKSAQTFLFEEKLDLSIEIDLMVLYDLNPNLGSLLINDYGNFYTIFKKETKHLYLEYFMNTGYCQKGAAVFSELASKQFESKVSIKNMGFNNIKGNCIDQGIVLNLHNADKNNDIINNIMNNELLNMSTSISLNNNKETPIVRTISTKSPITSLQSLLKKLFEENLINFNMTIINIPAFRCDDLYDFYQHATIKTHYKNNIKINNASKLLIFKAKVKHVQTTAQPMSKLFKCMNSLCKNPTTCLYTHKYHFMNDFSKTIYNLHCKACKSELKEDLKKRKTRKVYFYHLMNNSFYFFNAVSCMKIQSKEDNHKKTKMKEHSSIKNYKHDGGGDNNIDRNDEYVVYGHVTRKYKGISHLKIIQFAKIRNTVLKINHLKNKVEFKKSKAKNGNFYSGELAKYEIESDKIPEIENNNDHIHHNDSNYHDQNYNDSSYHDQNYNDSNYHDQNNDKLFELSRDLLWNLKSATPEDTLLLLIAGLFNVSKGPILIITNDPEYVKRVVNEFKIKMDLDIGIDMFSNEYKTRTLFIRNYHQKQFSIKFKNVFKIRISDFEFKYESPLFGINLFAKKSCNKILISDHEKLNLVAMREFTPSEMSESNMATLHQVYRKICIFNKETNPKYLFSFTNIIRSYQRLVFKRIVSDSEISRIGLLFAEKFVPEKGKSFKI